MRMKEAVLGIDLGTSGVRIAAVSSDLAVLAMTSAPLVAPDNENGRLTQDPASWWQAIETAFKSLNVTGIRILAIAIDGTSGTILPINAQGIPLQSASMYHDRANPTDLARVEAVAPLETAALGGSSPLARAFRLQASAHRIIHQADWIAGRLMGSFRFSDENNALKTGYDPLTRRWPDWIADTGFQMALLPEVVPSGTRIGTIAPTLADHFGLPRDTALVAGTTDGCAAFLASGAKQPGDGVTSLGSTLTIKVLSASPVFAPQYGIYSHRIGDQWLAGGASNTGGAVIVQYFDKEAIPDLELRLVPEHPTGLDYYPLPKRGERFPVNDPSLQPRLTPRPSDDATFFQGILEGIARVEALGYRRLAELGATPLSNIRSVGGGAGNAAWTKIRLRELQVPGGSSLSDHAAVGVARLAWRGIGHEA